MFFAKLPQGGLQSEPQRPRHRRKQYEAGYQARMGDYRGRRCDLSRLAGRYDTHERLTAKSGSGESSASSGLPQVPLLFLGQRWQLYLTSMMTNAPP